MRMNDHIANRWEKLHRDLLFVGRGGMGYTRKFHLVEWG